MKGIQISCRRCRLCHICQSQRHTRRFSRGFEEESEMVGGICRTGLSSLQGKTNTFSQNVVRNLSTGKCWPVAFGWINPLLGQMAPSPCRASKPQSACQPLFACLFVCVSFIKKKKKVWQACSGHHGGWICFGYRNMMAVCCPSPCVPLACLHTYLCVSMQVFDKDPRGRASVSSWENMDSVGWLSRDLKK